MKLFGPYKQRSRSASMQLSINAIVILVMAMAVLGIGLGLIRGVLGSGQDKLLGALESQDLTQQASADQPITNFQGIEVKAGGSEPFVVGYYNSGTAICAATLRLEGCKDSDGNAATIGMVSPEVSVGIGEPGKLGGVITAPSTSGTYICTLNVVCAAQDDPATPADESAGPGTVAISRSTFITAIV